MLDYLLFASTFFIVLLLTAIYLYPGSQKSTTIPGPEPVDSLEGNFPDIKSCGSLHEFLVKVHEIYGPIASFWAGSKLCVSIACLELFKEQAHVFDRPGELFRAAALLFGDKCLFMLNGVEGRKKHTFIEKAFSKNCINFFLKDSANLIKKQMKNWSKRPADQHFALYEEMSGLVVKLVANSMLGVDTKNQQSLNSFRGSLENILLEVDHYLLDNQDVDGKREQRLNLYKENVIKFLSLALKSRKYAEGSSKKHLMLIDDFLKMPESEALTDLMSIVFDAYVKCSLLLTWLGYYLALDTEVQNNLRCELSALKKNTTKFEDITNLENFQAVFKEVLRCANIVPYTARFQSVDTQIESYKVPAGTPVFQALGVVANDPSVFPNPKEFNPGHFKKGFKTPCHSFGFTGKRMCPGANFSTSMAAIIYAFMLDSFECHLISDQIVTPHYGVYVKPQEEIWLSLSLRHSD